MRLEDRLSGFPTHLSVSRGAVTYTLVPWEVIACRFPRQALSPRVNTAGDADCRVQFGMILRGLTTFVGTSELVAVAVSDVPAAELVGAVGRVVMVPPSVREPNRVILNQLLSVEVVGRTV